MLGAIVGDIIGSRFEFNPHKSCDFELFNPACRFTDDTVLTLATAAALLDQLPFDLCYRDFHQRYPRAGYGERFSCWAESGSKQPYNSFGNGSTMRIAPVAWVSDDLATLFDVATRSAAVTHNHPEGLKGALAVASAIFLARKGAGKIEIQDFIEDRFSYDLRRPLELIRPAYSFEVSCQKSVPEALCCFLESDDFISAIRLAVSLGGDSDTQAAIAGSVAEAFYGRVPSWVLEKALPYFDPFLLELCHRFTGQYMPGAIPEQIHL